MHCRLLRGGISPAGRECHSAISLGIVLPVDEYRVNIYTNAMSNILITRLVLSVLPRIWQYSYYILKEYYMAPLLNVLGNI